MKQYDRFAGYEKVRTAQNFGLEGLVARGFKSESVLQPGVNEDELQASLMGSFPTGNLMLFQLRRKFLAILHVVISWYKWLPALVKQSLAVRVGSGSIGEFEDAITSAWKWSTPDVAKVAGSLEKLPVHLAVILRYNQRIPEFQNKAGGNSDASVGSIQKLFRLQEQELKAQEAHNKRESDNLIAQITDLIYWCVLSNVPILTLYEQTGFTSDLDVDRIISVIREKLASGGSIPEVEIRLHIRSRGTQHRFHYSSDDTSSAASDTIVKNEAHITVDALANSSPHLDVVIVQQADFAAAFKDASGPLFSAGLHHESLPPIDATTPELLNEMIYNCIFGALEKPDMLVLLSSQAMLDGLPSYEVRNAFVYRDFTHRSAVDAKLFCRALKAFCKY